MNENEQIEAVIGPVKMKRLSIRLCRSFFSFCHYYIPHKCLYFNNFRLNCQSTKVPKLQQMKRPVAVLGIDIQWLIKVT